MKKDDFWYYELYRKDGSLKERSVRFDSIDPNFDEGDYVEVEHMTSRSRFTLSNADEWEGWVVTRERDHWAIGITGTVGSCPPVNVEALQDKVYFIGPLDSKNRAEETDTAPKKDHVNPSHYQGFYEEKQWIEVMSRIPRFRTNPEAFKGAIEFQVRKYLDRNGRKDEELQELKKALWYLKFLVAYVTNESKPIDVKDIESLLAA